MGNKFEIDCKTLVQVSKFNVFSFSFFFFFFFSSEAFRNAELREIAKKRVRERERERERKRRRGKKRKKEGRATALIPHWLSPISLSSSLRTGSAGSRDKSRQKPPKFT